ncbi:MAG: zf-HC2 domain-containing protein [Roseiflexaceae bacterium]|nr:zf-HC2 domain-containing protein [Roseiflexaceae bacterium]
MNCLDHGRIRAFLDGELAEFERATIASHLSTCAACRHMLAEVGTTADFAARMLAAPTVSAPEAALARFRSGLPISTAPQRAAKEQPMTTRTSSGPRRAWITSIATLAVLIGLLALPPVRAAADQLLQIFRVQQVVFVPISQERSQQLESLNFDGQSLFLSEPQFEGGEPQPPQSFASAEQAAAAGFALNPPTELPSAPVSTNYQGWSSQDMSFQVNVESARELLRLLDIQNVSIPDALGSEPVRVSVGNVASASLRGSGYTLDLTSGASPEVALPEGVDLSQLGSALLQIYGTAPAQAEAMARDIDWTSTLVVPFPADLSQVQQVQVNGANAMLMRGGNDESQRGLSMYWQREGKFYVLGSTGLDQTELIVAAESIK